MSLYKRNILLGKTPSVANWMGQPRCDGDLGPAGVFTRLRISNPEALTNYVKHLEDAKFYSSGLVGICPKTIVLFFTRRSLILVKRIFTCAVPMHLHTLRVTKSTTDADSHFGCNQVACSALIRFLTCHVQRVIMLLQLVQKKYAMNTREPANHTKHRCTHNRMR